MTIFDLFFIVVFLATVVILIIAVIRGLRGRPRQAVRLLAGYGVFLILYLGAVILVSLTTPQRVLAVGEDRCFDDWCLAVENVNLANELGQGQQAIRANGVFYIVTLRISNQGRGRDQRAASAAVHLVDDHGRMYTLSPQGQQAYEAQSEPVAPLTSTVQAGQSITTVQVFDLPADAHNVGLTIKHPVGPSPGLFVIGDDASLLHKPTIVRLP